MEVSTESLTCEPNKELSRSPPRYVPNIDIPDPADVLPASVSYPLPLLTPFVFLFDNVVIHIVIAICVPFQKQTSEMEGETQNKEGPTL